MTDVAFHLNVGDRTAYACRLMRKGYLRGSRLLVMVDASAIEALDRSLWLMGSHDFVPHALESDPTYVRRHSPVLIASHEVVGFDADVLVNLSSGLPPASGRFDRIIEIVGSETVDRQSARERWKQYKAMGVEPQAHDLAEGLGQ